jgi:hypothetical protein
MTGFMELEMKNEKLKIRNEKVKPSAIPASALHNQSA